ncbi:MAG: bifunctional adenosylcobinamide kinase/adenosylcobinamide-phosphate guanylyltransferase [Bacteroidales bacterium]|nr:bifunctional adenosylcobinamide kinase/adenosylcobinamide-phosphate guanylyltransferase [Bacteroidales bacterium]
MAKVIFITSGQRSGKSSFAMLKALELSANPVYLATSRIWDDDFENRVNRHKNDRTVNWMTIEEEREISKHDLTEKVVVLDCITLWLTNFFSDLNFNIEKSLEATKNEWIKFIDQDFTVFVISNEIGMGVHAETEGTRKFTDLQGWMNQYIAKQADEVFLMISGIPVKIASSL